MILVTLRNQKKQVVGFTLLDNEDAALAKKQWRLHKDGYAWRTTRENGRQRRFWLHREVLGLSPGEPLDADHINRDRLDNRRENLRRVTRGQNLQNVGAHRNSTSSYRGVSWDVRRHKWRSRVRDTWIGYFDDELDAARAASDFRATHMPFAVEVAA